MTELHPGFGKRIRTAASTEAAWGWLFLILVVHGVVAAVLLARWEPVMWRFGLISPTALLLLALHSGAILFLARSCAPDIMSGQRPRWGRWLSFALAYLVVDNLWGMAWGSAIWRVQWPLEYALVAYVVTMLLGKLAFLPLLVPAIGAAVGADRPSPVATIRRAWAMKGMWMPALGLVAGTIFAFVSYKSFEAASSGVGLTNGLFLLMYMPNGLLAFICTIFAIAVFGMILREIEDRLRIFE